MVTTLTKRTAEDLADYLRDVGLKVRYLHSDIDAIERVEILRGLRAADFDILVGINLLREGLDLPEVSLVCILDADKEGFLRSQTSLIQTAGRAARHVNGEVVLFADTVTQSMEALMSISEYRRAKQMDYNEKHGITPQTVRRAVQESLHTILRGREIAASVIREAGGDFNVTELLRELEEEMQESFGEPGIRARGIVTRPDHGSEKRRRHRQNRTQTTSGKILVRQPPDRPPPLARVDFEFWGAQAASLCSPDSSSRNAVNNSIRTHNVTLPIAAMRKLMRVPPEKKTKPRKVWRKKRRKS